MGEGMWIQSSGFFKRKFSLFRERVEEYGVEKMKDQVQQLRILNQNLKHKCIQVYLKPCVSRYTLNPVYPGILWTLCIQVYFELCASAGKPWTLCSQEYLESYASRNTLNPVHPGIPLTLFIQVYLEPCVSRYTLNIVYPGIPWTLWIQV